MAAVQRGLGRGLDALLQGIDADDQAPEEKGIVFLSISDIRPNAQQPRRYFEDEALGELADSIRSSGVLQPILVRPVDDGEHRYELVAGERRWRASQLAELTEIPAMVRALGDEESLAIALIENLQREDLNPIEEALGLKRLQEDFGLKQEDLAQKVGKSRPAIANTLRLLQLPEDIQVDIRNGSLSAGHGRSMLAVSDESAREMLHRRCMEQGLSVREAEAQAGYWKKTGELPGAMPENETKKAAGKTKSAPKGDVPAEVLALQERLAEALGLRVAVRGDMDKGRIVFGYADAGQLEILLTRLGVPTVPDDAMVAATVDTVGAPQEPPVIADLPESALDESLSQDVEPMQDEPAEDEAAARDQDAREPDDPIQAMLDGDDAPDLSAMLGDDEESDTDGEELDDFDDDELAELDKALDDILDETKNA